LAASWSARSRSARENFSRSSAPRQGLARRAQSRYRHGFVRGLSATANGPHRRIPAPHGGVSLARIRRYCDAIAREFRPLKIVLFGSRAYGQPTPDSDVDLLVILPFRGSDVSKAIEIRARFDTPFPLDLLVRKPEFIARRLRERDMFIELLMTQGRVMYESQHA
jgi:predicted nucleotidyltransferase